MSHAISTVGRAVFILVVVATRAPGQGQELCPSYTPDNYYPVRAKLSDWLGGANDGCQGRPPRPQQKTEHDRITYLVGYQAGSSVRGELPELSDASWVNRANRIFSRRLTERLRGIEYRHQDVYGFGYFDACWKRPQAAAGDERFKKIITVYVVYMIGYMDGTAARARWKIDQLAPPPPPPPLGEQARAVAEDYVKYANALAESASTLAKLLATDAAFPEFAGAPEGRRDQAIAFTKWNLERARLLAEAHSAMRESAGHALSLHPDLLAALRAVADALDRKAAAAEFPHMKESYRAEADDSRRFTAALEATPPSLPDDFERLGRFIGESAGLLDDSLRHQELKRTLALKDGSKSNYEATFNEFCVYFLAWRDTHLAGWEEGRAKAELRRYLDAYGAVAGGGAGDDTALQRWIESRPPSASASTPAAGVVSPPRAPETGKQGVSSSSRARDAVGWVVTAIIVGLIGLRVIRGDPHKR